jgi:hypothetical protein
MTIFVFPSSIESALAIIEEGRRHGRKVIGSSSIKDDPYAWRFDAWTLLPYLQDPLFPEALAKVLTHWKVTQIWTTHAPTFHFLNLHLHILPTGIELMQPSPYERQSKIVQTAWGQVEQKQKKISLYAGKTSPYTSAFVVSLLNQASALYGECCEEKALALCGVMADMPKGDVIEIGSFFGKSAYLLNRLAVWNQIGSTIAVDPWSLEVSVQKDSPEEIQSLSAVWDWKEVFEGFLMTTAAATAGSPFNYLRMTSEKAWAYYDCSKFVESVEFGYTPVTGKISLLHIDGNHDENDVSRDYLLWSQRLVDGGWIIFDDYEWSHGRGPRNVAERVRCEAAPRILREIVTGGALFLKIAKE